MPLNAAVSLIITPRERFSVAPRALESVIANTPNGCQGIYVAGGASREVQAYLERTCASAGYRLILRDEFLAPNVARNLGLAQAQSKYLVFLDNDVVVEPGWLDALVGCAEEENADIVTPLVLIGEPRERNLHSLGGALIVERVGAEIKIQERHHVRPIKLQEYAKPLIRQPSDYAEFHCALIPRSVFDRISPFDEQILGAAEHIDLALHLREIGGRGFAEPAAIVSYLPTEYTLGDLANYSRRWSDEWFEQTMDHLVSKWNLSATSALLSDYRSSHEQLRARCLLGREPRAVQPLTEPRDVAQTIVQLLDQMQRLGYRREEILIVRDSYLVAAELFSGSFRSSGRTFLAHLVGVASILASTGSNSTLVAAAVLHAAYTQAPFPHEVGGNIDAMRRWLKRRVGDSIEALVFAYSHLVPQDVAAYVSTNLDRMPIADANVILIRMANAIEDRVTGDYRYFDSAAWLEQSNAQIAEALPSYEPIARKLGVGQLSEWLRATLAATQSGASPSPLRPSRPLNYTIDARTGTMAPLPERRITPDMGQPRRGAAPTRVSLAEGSIIDPRVIEAQNNAVVEAREGCVEILTDEREWSYSARISLPDHLSMSGPAAIAIELQVERGHIGVLILERGHSVHQLANEQDATAGHDPVTLVFELAAIEEAGDIMFRKWPGDEGAARLRLLAVRAVPLAAAASEVVGYS
jgi:hypothetical protein